MRSMFQCVEVADHHQHHYDDDGGDGDDGDDDEDEDNDAFKKSEVYQHPT